jgi:23S rRNA (guanosine2251-2'-O)-methyltransferase
VIVYGRNAVRELVAARRRPVQQLWAAAGAAREPWLADREVTVVDAAEVARRCGSDAHQGICAQTVGYPYVSGAEILAPGTGVVVVLDELQDPQNVGAICRSSEALGAAGVVIPERRSAEVTPAVCKASAGAVEHLRIAHVRNIADFLTDAKGAGFWCYGADMDARVAVGDFDWPDACVIVLGAEGRGVRPRVAKSCDELVRIPMRGAVASLNVSATAAIVLHAALRSGRNDP